MMEIAAPALMFYLFAAVMLFSGIMVIISRNPVHSVLFLIFTFFNAAGLLVMLGAEYIAMTLVIVYVGAVAVLFLFVVMMMNINVARMREGFTKQLPVGLVVALLLMGQLGAIYYASFAAQTPAEATKPASEELALAPAAADVADQAKITNAEAIGRLLYTDYAYIFMLAGLVLLVAMVGAIVLTLHHSPSVKRQRVSTQIGRRRRDSVSLANPESGKGVRL